MIRIANNGDITIHRGDTFKYPIYLNIGTKLDPVEYKLHSRDTVYVSIMEPNKEFELGIFRRKYTKEDFLADGTAILFIKADDTKDLLPGLYYLLIKVKLFNGKYVTATPRKKFIILE